VTESAANRALQLEQRLRAALTINHLEIEDESHLHAGHAGAKEGKSHFSIVIGAAEFAGKPPLKQHQLVYAAAGDLMHTDIHALSIQIINPSAATE
jgi:BolA protein